jgi:transposase-like protein
MMKETPLPKTLQEAAKAFADEQFCIDLIAAMRWVDGQAVCPKCHEKNNHFMASRKVWQCKNKECKKQFSVKVGTIFEDSAIPLEKWMLAMWLIVNAKNGISSYELHRALGITQKSAWFMLHRIRTAMTVGSIEKLSGEVETDETYIGGDSKNMHSKKRKRRVKGPGSPAHKVAVIGMVQRGGKVRAKVTRGRDAGTIRRIVTEHVEHGSEVITDEWRGYINLRDLYTLKVINHSIEYVRENVHTNNIENFWSLLKRTIKGTYISVSPAHLQKYVEEQMFRYNERETNDQIRFVRLLESISGKRLTYASLIGYEGH